MNKFFFFIILSYILCLEGNPKDQDKAAEPKTQSEITRLLLRPLRSTKLDTKEDIMKKLESLGQQSRKSAMSAKIGDFGGILYEVTRKNGLIVLTATVQAKFVELKNPERNLTDTEKKAVLGKLLLAFKNYSELSNSEELLIEIEGKKSKDEEEDKMEEYILIDQFTKTHGIKKNYHSSGSIEFLTFFATKAKFKKEALKLKKKRE